MSSLRSRPFRLLVAGSAINGFGNALTPVALAFAVVDLGGSATDLGLVVGAFALAEVVTVLLGGVLGDRLSRRLLLQGSSYAAAVAQAVTAAAVLGGWADVGLLAALAALNGALAAVASPSSQALTGQCVEPVDLPAAVSVRRLVATTSQIAGFGAGGVLVAGIGPGWAIAVDALTFAVAGLCFAGVRVPEPARGPRSGLLGDLRDGASEVLRHTWLWMLILVALVYHLFYGGVQGVLGPLVVGEQHGRAAWGISLAILMSGFLAGGLLSLRWRPRRGLLAGTATLALTAAFPAALALQADLPVVLAAAFLHGFGLEIFSVNWDLSLQQQVAPDRLARVYAFDMVGSFVARPLGLVLTGPVAAAVGYSRWLSVVAGVMLGSVALALLSREVRGLERRAVEPLPAAAHPDAVADSLGAPAGEDRR